ncbi:MAG: hypothetical protein H0W96_06435 [Solirubrobacterales bacterium]|nr:hypothetical protein [Solirubrobacterales bacterium]
MIQEFLDEDEIGRYVGALRGQLAAGPATFVTVRYRNDEGEQTRIEQLG